MRTDITPLTEIMAQLRDPNDGCPWDLEQDFSTIAPYTIEEAYEVADAIERNDLDGLKDELGDLLLQVVFHSQMASELGAFGLATKLSGMTLFRKHGRVLKRLNVAVMKTPVRWPVLPSPFPHCCGHKKYRSALPVLALTGRTSPAHEIKSLKNYKKLKAQLHQSMSLKKSETCFLRWSILRAFTKLTPSTL